LKGLASDMTDHEPVTQSALRDEARSVYGADAAGYAAGRPDYPAQVYQTLTDRCGLGPGTLVLEIGPGTGLVTGRLLDYGARAVAVEPDPAMAAYLTARYGTRISIVTDAFEHASLAADSFDLVVAATSFHWVDQAVGVPKLSLVLRPGGWAAMWWTIFDDPSRADPFRDALESRLGEADPGRQRNAAFFMSSAARTSDLRQLGGFTDVTADVLRWDAVMDAAQLRALYASMIMIRRRPPAEQERILTAVSAVAAGFPHGTVSRPFVTVCYTARKPAG